MRMSALATAAGLPVATVKFYLREGLLPPGHATSATQADYDSSHVDRLRLVRALVEVASLPLSAVRTVLDQLDDPAVTWHSTLGVASAAAGPRHDRTEGDDSDRAQGVVADLGWQVHPQSTAIVELERALEAIDAAGLAITATLLKTYACAAHQVADLDVLSLPTSSPQDAARHVVLGTVLFEPLLLALRRLAHEDVSARLFGE